LQTQFHTVCIIVSVLNLLFSVDQRNACRDDVRRDPVFRAQFHTMCANVGVDPLASNKGMWAQLLHFGDFYYELGVQIVEACLASRAMNGGLIDLDLLRAHVTVRPQIPGSRHGFIGELRSWEYTLWSWFLLSLKQNLQLFQAQRSLCRPGLAANA